MRDSETCGISYMSTRLLALETQSEQFAFINSNMEFLKQSNIEVGAKFVHRNFITCMHRLARNVEGETS